MKISSALFGCSVLANVALAAVLFIGFRSAPAATSVSTSAPRTATRSALATADGSAAGSSIALDPETWSRLQNSDLGAYRARLEAEGFPPRLARALAAEEIRRQFAPRRAALNLKATERPFWERTVQDPKTTAELRQINREQAQAVRELLGPDPNDFSTATLRAQLPTFSEDKIAQIMRVQQDFNDRRVDANGGAVFDPDKLDAFNRDLHAEIAKLLTPDELEAYDLRTSPLAARLRNQFGAFDATEDEFVAVFRLQNNYNDRLPTLRGRVSPEEMQARAAIQKQLDGEIRTALGDERFEQYQRSQDYGYQQTNSLVGRLELPRSATDEVWAVQKDIQQRAGAVRSDRTLTPAARTQQLAALAEETRTRVTATLGDRGFEAYKQYGGAWLRSLQPPPPPPPAAP
jgi:hypothetical protein